MSQENQLVTQMAEKAQVEQRMMMQEYEKEVQLLKIEEQRRLRQIEEEQIMRKQQAIEDIKRKGGQSAQYEARKVFDTLGAERERDRAKATERMEMLD